MLTDRSHLTPIPTIRAGRTAPSRWAVYLGILVVLSLGLNLYGIDWGLPNGEYDWSNDSVAPLGPLLYAKKVLSLESWSAKYPPFHYMVLTLLYAPYLLYLALSGGLTTPSGSYPYGLSDPEFSLMVFTLIARLTSAAMGTATAVVTYFTVKHVYDRGAGLVAALLVASSYPIIHYSHNANVDIPQLFWISLALYSFVRLRQTYATKHYILLGVFAAAAVGTKNSAYALFVGLAPMVLASHLHHEAAAGWRSLFSPRAHRKLLYGLVATVLAVMVAFNLPFNWEGFNEHVARHLQRSVKGSKLIRVAPSAVEGEIALIGRYAAFLFETNVAPVFLLLVAGFAYCAIRFPARAWTVAVAIVIYYVSFLRIHGSEHLRYALPVYLLLTWQGGKLAADAAGSRRAPGVVATAALAAVLGYALLQGASVGMLYGRDPRYAAEAWMQGHVPSGARIVGVKPDYSLPRFPPGVELTRRDLWSYNAEPIGDIQDVDPDYIVLGMSLQRRRERAAEVEGFFRERGYSQAATFKARVPFFGREIPDLHSINPTIVVFGRAPPGHLAARE